MKKVKSQNNKPKTSKPPVLDNSNFDFEVLWCIENLKRSLHSGKLNQREAERIEKAIKTLKSPKEVFIKKRQLMSNLLGNYREKIEKEKQESMVAAKPIKMTAISPSKKSIFIRKSLKARGAPNTTLEEVFDKLALTDRPADDVEASTSQKQKELCETEEVLNSKKVFRFAFNVEEEDDKR